MMINAEEIRSELVFNNHKDSPNYINQAVIILFCVWMTWPYLNFKMGAFAAAAILLVWVITTDYRWFIKAWPKDQLLIVVWFIFFIPYLITGDFMYGALEPRGAFVSFVLFTVGIFINHYYMFYKKDFVTLGRIALISIIMYIVGAFQTFKGLLAHPLASRSLATGIDAMQDIYLSLGIGGFGYIYSSVFICILSLFLVTKRIPKNNKTYKVLSLMLFVLLGLMITQASYTIALLLLFIGIILVLNIKGKKSLIVGVYFAIILLIIPKRIFGNFFINVSNIFKDNETLSIKFMDLAQGFLIGDAGVQTSYRLELYMISFKTFLSNPLFGIYGPLGKQMNANIGGHSGWLDLMAFYGIFGSIPLFLGILFNFRKQLSFYSGTPYYYFLLTVQGLFLFFGFINPIIYIYQIGFVLFVIAPSLPMLPYAFGMRNKPSSYG
ncbi:hypothetical protein ACXYMX_08555 [Sporosarcina sp. CAU 1771]